MSMVIVGPRARRVSPALREMQGQGTRGVPTPRYEWGVEIRPLSTRGREQGFYLLLTPYYKPRRPRAGGWIIPAREVDALARMLLAGAPLRRVVEAPLEYWGALPKWLRRKLARDILPSLAGMPGQAGGEKT